MDALIENFNRDFEGSRPFVDIHCHCLPGLDDGPATMEQAISVCRALVNDGVSTVIATPHQLGRYDGKYTNQDILEAVNRLRKELKKTRLDITILRGAEIRVDERIIPLLKNNELLTLGGSGYCLLELPWNIFIDIKRLVRKLSENGLSPVIAHIERYEQLLQRRKTLAQWLRAGAVFQINASSVTGHLGMAVQQSAWKLLEAGCISLVASDAHDVSGRPPLMSQAYRDICDKLGRQAGNLLCIENPRRVITGEKVSIVKNVVYGEKVR